MIVLKFPYNNIIVEKERRNYLYIYLFIISLSVQWVPNVTEA